MTSWLAPGELGQLSWSWRMEESGILHKLACLWVSPSILEPLSQMSFGRCYLAFLGTRCQAGLETLGHLIHCPFFCYWFGCSQF